ncbi:MAG TPA: FtsX-like permease family protein [Actinomycetes bacterium]|nr:FtsX-like permease family protein [Actinomycetes bacterium]
MSAPTLRTKLWRDLRRRRAQFAALAVTLFLGIALFVTSYDAFLNLQASYEELYARTHFADLTVTGGDLAAVAAAARSAEASVATRRVADIPLRIGEDVLLGRVVGMPARSQPLVNGVLVLRGGYLSPARPDGVLVEQHAASHFRLSPGASVRALSPGGWRTLSVAGVAASPEYLWPARSRQDVLTSPDDFAVLFVPQALAEELGGRAAQEQLVVHVPDRARVSSVVASLERKAGHSGATGVLARAEQPSNAALQEDVQGFDQLSLLFPILFLTAAAMAAWVLLTRLVRSQRPQIGTLRTFGAARRTVLGHYVGFGLAAGLLGGIPGAAAGTFGARLATGGYTRAIAVPVTVAPLHWTTALIGIAFGLVVGVIGAAGPALAASRVPPAEAMRGAVPSGAGGTSFLERAFPPLRRIPPAARMAVRGISRNRRRTLYTALGVVLALVLVLVSWGMLDSTQVLLARQFDQVQRQDAQVYLSGPATVAAVSRLAAVPGVAAAEEAAQLPVTVEGRTGSYPTALLALPPGTTMHGFLLAGGGTASLPRDGVLLGAALRSRLGIGVGDRIRLRLPSLGASVQEPVAGFVSEPLGTFAYASLPSLERALASGGRRVLVPGESLANTVMLRFSPSAGGAAMRARLSALPGVAAYVDARALQRAASGFMGLFYAFVGLMLVLGAILAFALVFNAMSVNVAERATEIATLRSEGVAPGRVGRLIGSESLLVVALGIPPGLLAGYLVAKGFMASFSSDLFRFDLAVRPVTFLLAAAAMLAVGLLSWWPALRAIRRVDLATVLRERAG